MMLFDLYLYFEMLLPVLMSIYLLLVGLNLRLLTCGFRICNFGFRNSQH